MQPHGAAGSGSTDSASSSPQSQTGFGPFFSVYLTEQGWSQVDIGFALSVGTASVLFSSLPAGMLVDAIHHKRFAIGLALLLSGSVPCCWSPQPTPGPVWAAQVTARRRQLHPDAGNRRTDAGAVWPRRPSANGWESTRAMLRSATRWPPRRWVPSPPTSSNAQCSLPPLLLVLPALATLPLFRISDASRNDHPALLHPKKRQRRNHRPWHIYS